MNEDQRRAADDVRQLVSLTNSAITRAYYLGLRIDGQVSQSLPGGAPYSMPQFAVATADGARYGRISAPSLSDDHPDRDLECQVALGHSIRAIINRALTAGWSEGEINNAISQLADYELLPSRSIEDTNALIHALRSKSPKS